MSTTQTSFNGAQLRTNLDNIEANAFSNSPQGAPSSPHGANETSTDNAKEGGEVMFKTQQCRTYATKGRCPYEYHCMYAHGPSELRTKEMNLRDGLTTRAQVKVYQRKLEASGYSTSALRKPSPASPLSAFGSMAVNNSSYPASPFGMGSAPAFSPGNSLPTSPMTRPRVNDNLSPRGAPGSPFPWMQQPTMSSPTMHMKGCDCRECRMATAQAAQAQALACPCPECLAAAAAAVAAITACRLVAARKAQEQAQLCPCPECIGAAQAALAAASQPCPCPDCSMRGCNDGSSMGAPTSGVSTSAPSSPVSRLSSRDYMQTQ